MSAWSNRTPTERGFYFARRGDDDEITIHEISDNGLVDAIGYDFARRVEELSTNGWEWWPVPIKPPEPA